MCTPYKIEAFADNSRPGSQVKPHERRRLEALILLGFFELYS